ncbi:MAG TPA: hypothetical protein VHU84_02540 [Lacipirellulaceae bacterium]|jgi:hypothetical protein|nr:hypothetical protein [Lacipirellulaceae bacterium]
MQRPRIVRGRPYGIAALWVIAVSASFLSAAEVIPYEARVVATGAAVHSGPGEKFYPTDTLAQGDTVDVYREKPDGWLGIRPTVNSFSLVRDRDLKLREGGLAEITKDNVPSRIGSLLDDQHNASQVRLKKGEVVEVLGEEKINGDTWYKIGPPAGEFRWIQASLVERQGPIKQVSAESTTPAPSSNSKAATQPSSNTTATPSGVATAPPLLPTTPAAVSNSTPAGPSNSSASNPPAAPVAAPAAAAPPPTTAAPATSNASDDLSHDLIAIEVRLSRMAAAPSNLWNTERLERDAAQLMNRAQTPADREAVQATVNKINRFAAIARRTNGPTTSIAQNGQSPVTPLPGTTPGALATTPGGSPYDAVGILRPVVSRRPGAPQFALVDDKGQVLTFVTPTPDMNLSPYLGQRVGVVGNRGFIAEFNRSHVTAARVTPLSAPLVR